MINTIVQLNETPVGVPKPSDFKLATAEVANLQNDEVLCQIMYLSLDPYMRSQISGLHISGSVLPGTMMNGETVARVIDSKSDEFKKGDIVRGFGGWQQYAVLPAKALTKLPADASSYSAYLSALGSTGLTAYAALILKGAPKQGDTVVIPAATGGVGSTAAQLAKIYGCKVIGIAGGEEKCRLAVEKLGYDACIDRKNENVAEKLKEYCPDGVDIYLDLVGGETLNIVSTQLAIGARVILCGIMSEVNKTERSGGPMPAMWIKSRATVYGFVVYDFEGQRAEFIKECQAYIDDKRLMLFEEITTGIENAPDAFCRLMNGKNIGKVIVKVSE
ncbi:NADP-dependent oxidoreductase [Aliiglaciecola sp. NS0011-25]|uniref:NADP-dependent oxidoreductase n=1 Tax=Aliiglaciecola sp. NS0011-25 TaxID=3127654 RepID=UPI003105FB0F